MLSPGEKCVWKPTAFSRDNLFIVLSTASPPVVSLKMGQIDDGKQELFVT